MRRVMQMVEVDHRSDEEKDRLVELSVAARRDGYGCVVSLRLGTALDRVRGTDVSATKVVPVDDPREAMRLFMADGFADVFAVYRKGPP